MYRLPKTIEFSEGRSFHIRNDGDFRVALECLSCLEDASLTETERVLSALIIFYGLDCVDDLSKLPDIEEAARKMYWFLEADMAESRRGQPYRLMSWETDSALICASINKVAGKEIRDEPYVHWWTFLGYYMTVGEGPLSTVISIRSKILGGKKLEKWEMQFRTDNPQYFDWDHKTLEQKEDDEWLRSVWNAEGAQG